MFGKLEHDAIETAVAIRKHGARVAYDHMLAAAKARCAGGNKHNTSLKVYSIYEATQALDVRGVDTANHDVQPIIDDMEV